MFDVSDDLISLCTTKAYGRAAGTWQMMLSYEVVTSGAVSNEWRYNEGRNPDDYRYNKLITPNDTVTIEMDAGDGSGMKVVMLGLVDRVSAVRQGGARPQRQVKISGQDMGKLLVTHDISWDIRKYNLGLAQSGDNEGEKSSTQLNRQFDPSLTMGTPVDLVTGLFVKAFREVLPQWSGRFGISPETHDEWQIRVPGLIQSSQGAKIWEVMKRYEHRPFNVLHTETQTTDVFYIILERQPFKDNGQLDRTGDRLHMIDDTEIICDDIGTCDSERCNFLFYKPDLYLTAVDGVVDVMMGHPDLVRYDEYSIEKDGYCPLVLEDSFLPPEISSIYEAPLQGDYFTSARDAADLLWGWYQNNHSYESGSIQLHLNPCIKAGDGLIHDRGNGEVKEFLVEQVSHQFAVHPQPQFITTLQLSRGQKYHD